MGGGDHKETFIVKILNRQNSTWQGNVTWVEEQESQNFRSALELIKMIDGALDSRENEATAGESEKGEGSHEEMQENM